LAEKNNSLNHSLKAVSKRPLKVCIHPGGQCFALRKLKLHAKHVAQKYKHMGPAGRVYFRGNDHAGGALSGPMIYYDCL